MQRTVPSPPCFFPLSYHVVDVGAFRDLLKIVIKYIFSCVNRTSITFYDKFINDQSITTLMQGRFPAKPGRFCLI